MAKLQVPINDKHQKIGKPMPHQMTVKAVLAHRFDLGECPRWDEKTQTIFWVDINQQQLHSLCITNKQHQWRQFSEQIGCFTLRESGGFVIAGESGFWFLNSLQGEMQFIGDPEKELPQQRFNDGRCDRQGRFIAGTTNPLKNQSFGKFYQLNEKLNIRPLVGHSWTCNGLAFSPDQRTLYWSDTPERRIYQCDYDLQSGEVTNQRLFFQVPDHKGRPDGASIDSKGNYWSALYGGSEVICINPLGKLIHTVKVPVTNPTMVTFGGDDLKTMYITSAKQKLSEIQLKTNPIEGALMIYAAPYAGLLESRFRG